MGHVDQKNFACAFQICYDKYKDWDCGMTRPIRRVVEEFLSAKKLTTADQKACVKESVDAWVEKKFPVEVVNADMDKVVKAKSSQDD